MIDPRHEERLEHGLEQLSLVVSDAARQRLLDYVALLVKWNRVYNLTAVRDPEQMISRHLLDSLVLLPWLESLGAKEAAAEDQEAAGQNSVFDLLDIGSGGGLPVIPLAIARPQLSCLSVETNGKKTRFQKQVGLELGLQNLTVSQARIEQCTQKAKLIPSRAFTAPADFLEIAARHCVPGGLVIVMLGQAERLPDPLPETFELQELQAQQVPAVDAPRHLAICRMRNE